MQLLEQAAVTDRFLCLLTQPFTLLDGIEVRSLYREPVWPPENLAGLAEVRLGVRRPGRAGRTWSADRCEVSSRGTTNQRRPGVPRQVTHAGALANLPGSRTERTASPARTGPNFCQRRCSRVSG